MRSVIIALILSMFVTVPAATSAQPANMSPDEALYLGRATAWISMAQDSLNTATQLTGTPQFGNMQWENDLLGEAAIWGAIHKDVQRVTDVPPRFATMHQHVDDAFTALEQARVHTRQGIEQDNADEILLAAEYITDFNESIQLASAALE